MIGIYKYQNKINHKIYIGQSIDLEQRRYAHKSSAFNKNAKDYNSQFHQAIRKYGLENFSYEILEENIDNFDELNEKEIAFIQEFQS